MWGQLCAKRPNSRAVANRSRSEQRFRLGKIRFFSPVILVCISPKANSKTKICVQVTYLHGDLRKYYEGVKKGTRNREELVTNV